MHVVRFIIGGTIEERILKLQVGIDSHTITAHHTWIIGGLRGSKKGVNIVYKLPFLGSKSRHNGSLLAVPLQWHRLGRPKERTAQLLLRNPGKIVSKGACIALFLAMAQAGPAYLCHSCLHSVKRVVQLLPPLLLVLPLPLTLQLLSLAPRKSLILLPLLLLLFCSCSKHAFNSSSAGEEAAGL